MYRRAAIDETQMRWLAEKFIARRMVRDSWKPKYDRGKLRVGVLCSRCSHHSRMQYR